MYLQYGESTFYYVVFQMAWVPIDCANVSIAYLFCIFRNKRSTPAFFSTGLVTRFVWPRKEIDATANYIILNIIADKKTRYEIRNHKLRSS